MYHVPVLYFKLPLLPFLNFSIVDSRYGLIFITAHGINAHLQVAYSGGVDRRTRDRPWARFSGLKLSGKKHANIFPNVALLYM